MPPAAVEAAIADGRSRGGIRDLAGWVVYLLRQRRDHGWTPPPPAPRADAQEILGAYFAQLVAGRAAVRATEQADELPPVACPAEAFPVAMHPSPPANVEQRPPLADVCQDTLAGLRLRLPRELCQMCVRQATLLSYADGTTATVSLTRTRKTNWNAATWPRCALRSAIGLGEMCPYGL